MTHYRASEDMSLTEHGTTLTISYNPCPDEDAARELELWGDNTEPLYLHREWIKKGADKAADKGTFSLEQLTTALKKYYLAVAKDYCKVMGGDYRAIFPGALREWVAEKDAEELRHEICGW